MGVVDIPASVPAGGELGVHLELDRDELASTVDRLKSAVQALLSSNSARCLAHILHLLNKRCTGKSLSFVKTWTPTSSKSWQAQVSQCPIHTTAQAWL